MNCFKSARSRKRSPTKMTSPETVFASKQENVENKRAKEEMLLEIPGCTVHLMEGGEALELAKGVFRLVRLTEDGISLATIVKVGDELQWPLTKDEPVVKLDALHYLFSLPMKDDDPLSYGVSFLEQFKGDLGLLDSFLKEHSCFTGSSSTQTGAVDWKDFAPRIEDYNGVLAKAIAEGTGEIVKGIFKCSNAYTKKVQNGGEMIVSRVGEEKNKVSTTTTGSKSSKSSAGTKKSGVQKGLKRVRKLSKMTEKMSKSLLDGVGVVTGSVVVPLARSQAGKTFLAMVPGEVLLASLDAVNKVLDAVEVAEKQALSATSRAATRMVSQRFGENAGEITEDVFATAGHCAGTAWNIFKIRKAINPASSVPSAILKSPATKRRQ
ncbi:PREDICTED: senescence/dehydration-associated protein At4g35985, chloroplastic-like [Nelumbo nucifera]|uniref:Senescence/dehydration-associated protein At4g35985, chloroplastic-like n=1 Tax=Nelumbo nucifera TaxID=4432 RepID=A0A1U8AM63_NELNU|nr:PREDICTED: senescence/dehydration-associated protein At4g35985, chloroplastic-like [Nelumbo nucifera]